MEVGTLLLTADGKEILYAEGTHKHMQAHPEVARLLHVVIEKISLDEPDKAGRWEFEGESGNIFGFEIDMGKMIGFWTCISMPSDGPMQFALRRNREIPTRVVLGLDPVATNSLTLWIREHDDGHYELASCYAGKFAPREPSDPFFTTPRPPEIEVEFQQALAFWMNHALIHEIGNGEPYTSTWQEELEKLSIL